MRHSITVDEFHRMSEARVFDHDLRIELLDGDLVERHGPMAPRRACAIAFIHSSLIRSLEGRACVSSRLPITLGTRSELDPDVSVVRNSRRSYYDRHPRQDEALAIIEVADSSRDLTIGLQLAVYAAHEVPESWVVDVVASRLHVYRDPRGTAYASETISSFRERAALLAFPDVQIRLADVFEET